MATSIVNAVGAFTEDDIIKIAPEVVKPDLEGWEFFVESMGVQIHRKYKEVSGNKGELKETPGWTVCRYIFSHSTQFVTRCKAISIVYGSGGGGGGGGGREKWAPILTSG